MKECNWIGRKIRIFCGQSAVYVLPKRTNGILGIDRKKSALAPHCHLSIIRVRSTHWQGGYHPCMWSKLVHEIVFVLAFMALAPTIMVLKYLLLALVHLLLKSV